MDISIVIPLYNEAESLRELHRWITSVMKRCDYTYEIIFVDDGSKDDSWQIIKNLADEDPHIRAIRFRRNYGKSAALNEGFRHSRGRVVITMDADLQDSPEEIPALYKMIVEEGYDLVSGWKKDRKDPALTKNLPSRLYNFTTRLLSGVRLHDMNCGLKAYRRDVVKSIEVYGEMHRYIPVIAYNAGFDKIGEKVVKHYPRKFGKTKFGASRFVNGLLDLMSILFVTKFGKRPMHLFGTLGLLTFLLGGLVTVWLIAQKLYGIAHKLKPRDVVDQPLFYLALVAVVVGVQLFLTGFVAELVSRTSVDRNFYLISEKLRVDE